MLFLNVIERDGHFFEHCKRISVTIVSITCLGGFQCLCLFPVGDLFYHTTYVDWLTLYNMGREVGGSGGSSLFQRVNLDGGWTGLVLLCQGKGLRKGFNFSSNDLTSGFRNGSARPEMSSLF